jgi:hypothetical protein
MLIGTGTRWQLSYFGQGVVAVVVVKKREQLTAVAAPHWDRESHRVALAHPRKRFRSNPPKLRMPEPNRARLLGSGVVPV